jgi:hypothetical protein
VGALTLLAVNVAWGQQRTVVRHEVDVVVPALGRLLSVSPLQTGAADDVAGISLTGVVRSTQNAPLALQVRLGDAAGERVSVRTAVVGFQPVTAAEWVTIGDVPPGADRASAVEFRLQTARGGGPPPRLEYRLLPRSALHGDR